MQEEPKKDPEQIEEELERYLDSEETEAEGPSGHEPAAVETAEGTKPIDELDLGENIESTKEIRARETIKAERAKLYQVGPEAQGLVEDEPAEVRMDEPLEGAGIAENFEPSEPAKELDAANLEAAAAAGADVVSEIIEDDEEEEDE